jgi:hypothetical protein
MALLQCKAETGTTTYDDGMETEAGTNDGRVVGMTDQIDCGAEAGTMMVPKVETTSPDEMTYKVVVSMMTSTVLVATETGKTVETSGKATAVGTTETVMVGMKVGIGVVQVLAGTVTVSTTDDGRV